MCERAMRTIDRDLFRARLSEYTRRAFHLLPTMDRPHILDIGCGSGVPTIELAHLGNGQIVAVDIDDQALHRLKAKVDKLGLAERVTILTCSMRDLDFPVESFDVVWAEGSVAAIGFATGLKQWHRFLKPNGYLVIHDDMRDTPRKLEEIPRYGYELVGYFSLSAEVWWAEYYGPLQEQIEELRRLQAAGGGDARELERAQREVDVFKENPERCASVFFVMQKRSPE